MCARNCERARIVKTLSICGFYKVLLRKNVEFLGRTGFEERERTILHKLIGRVEKVYKNFGIFLHLRIVAGCVIVRVRNPMTQLKGL